MTKQKDCSSTFCLKDTANPASATLQTNAVPTKFNNKKTKCIVHGENGSVVWKSIQVHINRLRRRQQLRQQRR